MSLEKLQKYIQVCRKSLLSKDSDPFKVQNKEKNVLCLLL